MFGHVFVRVSYHFPPQKKATVHHFPQATLQLVLQSKPWPLWLRREMRSNWAGETGAVAIYRGSHWALRPGEAELRSFVEEHVAAEEAHLEAMERCLG